MKRFGIIYYISCFSIGIISSLLARFLFQDFNLQFIFTFLFIIIGVFVLVKIKISHDGKLPAGDEER
jgi:uncharacterized membrane protein YeaQ/YmgE (transglycosylase-associated protein family)